MSTARIPVTFISVQDAKPSYSYENPQYPPLEHNHSRVLVRAAMPSLPAGSVVTSATLHVNQTGTWSGSNTLLVQRNYATWTNKATWNTKPTLGGPSSSQAQTGTTPGTWWSLDVTADVQGFLGGTRINWGWSLYTTSTTRRNVRGSTAPTLKPYLEVVYQVPAKVPTDLSPQGGAVSVAKPILTFTTSGETTAIQVQIDAASDAVTPDFDSGSVAATGGVLDLADTSYPGLSDGSSTTWRARQQTAGGWSPWSPWVSFSRSDLAAVTIISPTTTSADSSPPVEWSYAGTQVAWQVVQIDAATERTVADSGRVAGTDTAWTPAPIFDEKSASAGGGLVDGYQGITIVRVWDDTVRIATPGKSSYSESSVTWTLAFDGTVDPLDTLTVAQTSQVPGVNLAGTRAAGTPDEVAIYRNDALVARLVGTDVFTGTAFAWTDWSAPMNIAATYRVAPVVNGAVSADGPTVTVTPTCSGLWLVDPDTDTAVVLWGQDAGSWSRDDVATVHLLANGQTRRRRLAQPPRSGSASGEIVDAGTLSADDTLAAFDTFGLNDAGTVYRFIAGHLNLAVYAGNFLTTPTPLDGTDAWSRGQFDWWGAQ